MFWLFKKKPKQILTPDESRYLDIWLADQGFAPEQVNFSIYRDAKLMHAESSLVIVGFGEAESTSTGFVAELSVSGIVEANLIHPGTASYHRDISKRALYSGDYLVHALVSKSLQLAMRS